MSFNEFTWQGRLRDPSRDRTQLTISGHGFPPDPGLTDAERIAHLEDAVRALYVAAVALAEQVNRLSESDHQSAT